MNDTILAIRLGAMGDVLHTLPAIASLKKSFPNKQLVWLIAQKWVPLVAGNPHLDRLIPFERTGLAALGRLRRELSALEPGCAIDFQGLLQSAVAGRMAHPRRFFGFDRSIAREPLASLLYTDRVRVAGPHRIERNLQLIAAAGACQLWRDSWIPPGRAEGELPKHFVLASPFAGWKSKEWPLAHYDSLARLLAREGLSLVANVPPERTIEMREYQHIHVHTSSLDGLIDATRRATAIVGGDSGPLHLAAALKKPGVALFGPTDPAQTGPFESPMCVLREPEAKTSYKRGREVHASMSAIAPERVLDALLRSLTHADESLEMPASIE